jgi:hypothetical protein
MVILILCTEHLYTLITGVVSAFVIPECQRSGILQDYEPKDYAVGPTFQ